MEIKAGIFDLDGTLIDSINDIAYAMNYALSSNGLPTHEASAYNYFAGDGVHNLTNRVMPPGSSLELIEKVKAEYIAYYSANSSNRTKPYDGVIEMLRAFNEKNLPIAVLSNKSHLNTNFVVAHYFPGITFAAVVGAREGIPIKPDPTGALEIAKVIQIEPENILYLGDTSTDMQTAVNANMIAAGALWGFRKADELTRFGAKFLVEKPIDVLKLL